MQVTVESQRRALCIINLCNEPNKDWMMFLQLQKGTT